MEHAQIDPQYQWLMALDGPRSYAWAEPNSAEVSMSMQATMVEKSWWADWLVEVNGVDEVGCLRMKEEGLVIGEVGAVRVEDATIDSAAFTPTIPTTMTSLTRDEELSFHPPKMVLLRDNERCTRCISERTSPCVLPVGGAMKRCAGCQAAGGSVACSQSGEGCVN